jgi:HAD superfamily hydrolase (TIGR01549 family)
MGRIRGVLLDLDGTLVDSNDAHARAWADVFAAAGHDVTVDRVRRMIGMGGDKLVEAAVGLAPESDASQQLRKRHGTTFKDRYLSDVQRFPQVKELLARLRQAGLRYVVATSAGPDDLEAILAQTGLEELGSDATSSGDADESKPAPDIVCAAIDTIELPPEALVMVGDTPYDVEAARRAGVDCIAVRCGGWDGPDLAGAVAVYDHPADLLAHFADSPLAG